MNWAAAEESKVSYGDLITPLMGPNIRQPIPYSFLRQLSVGKADAFNSPAIPDW
jgi:hypothetical protein